MRSLPQSNLLAAFVVAVTLVIGAMGASGSPNTRLGSQHLVAELSPAVEAPSDIERPIHAEARPAAAARADESGRSLDVPRCTDRLAVGSGDLTFDCPRGWYVWENETFTPDPIQQDAVIISNKRPLEYGGDGLPAGWFKVDISIYKADAHLTFERLQGRVCSDRSEYENVVSCSKTTIGDRPWIAIVSGEPGYEFRSITTVVGGVQYSAIAYIPLVVGAADGRRQVAELFATFHIA